MWLTKTVMGIVFPWPIYIFKVLGILKGLLQKSLERGSGAEPLVLPLPYKPQFTQLCNRL